MNKGIVVLIVCFSILIISVALIAINMSPNQNAPKNNNSPNPNTDITIAPTLTPPVTPTPVPANVVYTGDNYTAISNGDRNPQTSPSATPTPTPTPKYGMKLTMGGNFTTGGNSTTTYWNGDTIMLLAKSPIAQNGQHVALFDNETVIASTETGYDGVAVFYVTETDGNTHTFTAYIQIS
jgi:hypothetical protein